MMYRALNQGFIEMIVGGMFAGKTEELIRRVSVLVRGKKKVLVFKPTFDQRDKKTSIYTHNKQSLPAYQVTSVASIKKIIQETSEPIDALAFDEIQFFAPEIVPFLEKKANEGYRIICAGLDKGYNDQIFITVMRLLSLCDFVTKLVAVCVICGGVATKTQRINKNKQPVGPAHVTNVIGGSDVYQARCRNCFVYFPE